MLKKYITLIIFVSFLLVSSEVMAQPGCVDPTAPGPPCPPGTPIGGGSGIAILLAAGAAYGIKKLRE